jgi:hypothetical protein
LWARSSSIMARQYGKSQTATKYPQSTGV